MAGFTKLFSDIIDSTIWREDLSTKVVWITMLAKADKHGTVRSSIPGLADAARVSLQDCQAALQKFLSPDEWSRTKDFEGKRIMETDGGWILLNYAKYRKIQDEDETRIATAERVRKFRENHRVTNVTDVTPSNAIAEAETEAETKKKKPSRVVKPKSAQQTIPENLVPVVEFLTSNWPGVSYGNGSDRRTVTSYSSADLWAKVQSLGEKFGKVPGAILFCGVPYLRRLLKDAEDSGKVKFAKDMSNFWGVKDGNRMWEDVYNQGLSDFNKFKGASYDVQS